MHAAGIVHLDLKLSNVMVGEDDKLKICDFGLAESSGKIVTIKTGTQDYMAPEVHRHLFTGVKPDIWSLGILLYALHFG
jgi:serine/threonine protein kinase